MRSAATGLKAADLLERLYQAVLAGTVEFVWLHPMTDRFVERVVSAAEELEKCGSITPQKLELAYLLEALFLHVQEAQSCSCSGGRWKNAFG